jgi:hypothetical protein
VDSRGLVAVIKPDWFNEIYMIANMGFWGEFGVFSLDCHSSAAVVSSDLDSVEDGGVAEHKRTQFLWAD